MPIAPPSLTMVMQSLRTCAGTSPLAAFPEPLASKPTQSMAESTVGEPVIAAILSGSSPSERMSIVSQPKERAWSRRSGMASPTMTHAAPRSWHDAAHARPTGPAPAT